MLLWPPFVLTLLYAFSVFHFPFFHSPVEPCCLTCFFWVPSASRSPACHRATWRLFLYSLFFLCASFCYLCWTMRTRDIDLEMVKEMFQLCLGWCTFNGVPKWAQNIFYSPFQNTLSCTTKRLVPGREHLSLSYSQFRWQLLASGFWNIYFLEINKPLFGGDFLMSPSAIFKSKVTRLSKLILRGEGRMYRSIKRCPNGYPRDGLRTKTQSQGAPRVLA